MICYVLAMGKEQLGPHVVVGYGIKIFWPGLFITSPDHLDDVYFVNLHARNYTHFGVLACKMRGHCAATAWTLRVMCM